MRLRSIVLAAVVLDAFVACMPAHAQRLDQQDFLKRAVFGGGKLWLLSDAGQLSTIRPGTKARAAAGLSELVLDVCASDGQVDAITCSYGGCSQWTLQRSLADGHWQTLASISAEADTLAALNCSASGDVVLTNRRLIEVASGKASTRALSRGFETRSITSVHLTADSVFVGINAGEWGGGLRRIERKTGKISVVERNESGGLCGGPLNTQCDPVNAIADTPWKPGCISAAVGLVHFMPNGRIVEICNHEVRSVYERPLAQSGTEAFFGLERAGSELVACGIDGIYSFSGSSEPKRTPLPAFERIGGIGVSFAIPGMVLVLTRVNQRRSVSGDVPMLVPR